jgi:hypothetical protein
MIRQTVDEKPAIQVLEHAPELELPNGRTTIGQSHDYGAGPPRRSRHSTRQTCRLEFLDFMNRNGEAYQGRGATVILDNLSTHKSKRNRSPHIGAFGK